MRYNLPLGDASEVFRLVAEAETWPDRECTTKRVRACTAFTPVGQRSNMAVVEFSLVSGYIPSKADLKSLVGYGTGILKRYEVDGNKVMFYLDEVTNDDVCINFRVVRDIDVEDVKPGSVRVYDYYEPEKFNEQVIVN